MRRSSLAIAAAGALLGSCSDDPRDARSGLGKEWTYDISAYRQVDPRLVRYVEMPTIDPGFGDVRGIAVGEGDRIYAGGDRAVRIFSRSGARIGEIPIDGEPRALAVSPSGRLYAAVRGNGGEEHVRVFGPAGEAIARWEGLGAKARIASIAATETDVFVADAGNRLVHRFDPAGRRIASIGGRDPQGGAPGFQIPSPYFDLAIDREGILWIANTGLLRIESYSLDGCLGSFWGVASPAIEGFCGCCNPAHFAIAPDGSFITSEKGLARVKRYDREGRFACVVAPPASFAEDGAAMDVAVDGTGRVLVLDPAARKIRIFVEGGS